MQFKTIDFSKFSAIKIGPRLEVLIIDKNNLFNLNQDYQIIGGANNMLIADEPSKPLAMLSSDFDYIKIINNQVCVGAKTNSWKLLDFAKKNDLKNFEFLVKLPGAIGGLVKMNAGLKQWQIFDHLELVKTNKLELKKQDIHYTYRYSNISGIIYEVIFSLEYGMDNNLLEQFVAMRQNQPRMPSAGSCFKNPEGFFAAKLLQDCGLKGKRIGNMSFSEQHANFLVNHGGGSFDEAMELINLAKQTVKMQHNITLEEEIIIL